MTVINNTLPPNDGNEYIMTENGWVIKHDSKPIGKQKFYTVKQASAETGCKISSLRTAIKSGFLLASRVPSGANNGDAIYINEMDLIDWLDDKQKVRDIKAHDTYLAYMRKVNQKARGKKQPVQESKPKKVVKANEENPNMDISSISEAIQRIIDQEVAKAKESYELKLKETYDKGYSDGKEQAALDNEDRYQEGYRDGIAEGRKKAAEEISVIAKGMYK